MDTPDAVIPLEVELTERFYRWERRGRGWELWDRPVPAEPPFRPFGARLQSSDGSGVDRRPADDGRRATWLGGVIGWLHRRLMTGAAAVADRPAETDIGEPEPLPHHAPASWTELQLHVPQDLAVAKETSEHLLVALGACRHALAFELIGSHDEIRVQLTCGEADADAVERQVSAYFPEVVVSRHTDTLADAWESAGREEPVVAEFGLGREFVLPLNTPRTFAVDPLVAMTAALSAVGPGEAAVLQVLFQPVASPWSESLLRSVVLCDGTPLFCSTRDYVGLAKVKAARPSVSAISNSSRVSITCSSLAAGGAAATRRGSQ